MRAAATVAMETCWTRERTVVGRASGLAAQSTINVPGGGSSSVLSNASAPCSVTLSARARTATRIPPA